MSLTAFEQLFQDAKTDIIAKSYWEGYKAGFSDGAEAQRQYIMNDNGKNPFHPDTVAEAFERRNSS